MNIVCITTGRRMDLLTQSLNSLRSNAADWSKHHLTLVVDNREIIHYGRDQHNCIYLGQSLGASAARNIGASSIPKYRRQDMLMFIDDDVYMCPRWDLRLGSWNERTVLSAHSHPFNHPVGQYRMPGGMMVDAAGVLSTVHLCMPWSIWDDVGYFVEPGGPGGSEDVEWCGRASKKGYGLAVTNPQCCIHCGLTSSSGKQIVGYELMKTQNTALVKLYGLEGKVQFG